MEKYRLWVFENRAPRIIFGLKTGEVTWGRRKLHNEDFHNSYPSPRIMTMNMSRKMRLADHVVHMGRRRMQIGYWWESQKERYH
jgi:hypothetical protein